MARYFIMMNSQDGALIMPIVDENDDVKLFETPEEAKEMLNHNSYLAALGGEIFECGSGELI